MTLMEGAEERSGVVGVSGGVDRSGGMSYSQGAYLLVSGNRKLIFSSKHKAATCRDDDSMQKSEVEEREKRHVRFKWKQLKCK